ncbi:MAG: DUF86 domain-containing protein [Oscillospiraceae bacterium]|nr:DUF86 domain-containing protein [Oscillospiraceae bacterium]
MNMNRDKVILKKIIDYADDIEGFISDDKLSKELFVNDVKSQYAINMCVLQIGEIANKFSAEFILKHTYIPWKKIISLRHKVVHSYYKINMDEIWDIATNHIPELKQECKKILKTL